MKMRHGLIAIADDLSAGTYLVLGAWSLSAGPLAGGGWDWAYGSLWLKEPFSFLIACEAEPWRVKRFRLGVTLWGHDFDWRWAK